MSLDYNPTPNPTVTPAQKTTGSQTDYGAPVYASASPGSDSPKLSSINKFSRIGHDVTDGAAVAQVVSAKGVV